MTLQEAERKSLARDLHDEFGQCLTAINTDANVILKRAKVQYPELQASAEAIAGLSRHLNELVSGLLQRLRPGVLDELGLVVALQDLVDGWRNRNEAVNCTLNIKNADDIANLDAPTSLVIYRLTQESLTNITRHANASNVTIYVYAELRKNQYGMTIKIQDDGVGFNPKMVNGLGLAGMRERVESLEGLFSLKTQLGKGSSVSAWISLDKPR